jgi:hypothetical protein
VLRNPPPFWKVTGRQSAEDYVLRIPLLQILSPSLVTAGIRTIKDVPTTEIMITIIKISDDIDISDLVTP